MPCGRTTCPCGSSENEAVTAADIGGGGHAAIWRSKRVALLFIEKLLRQPDDLASSTGKLIGRFSKVVHDFAHFAEGETGDGIGAPVSGW